MASVLEDEQSKSEFSFINNDKVIDLLQFSLKVVIIINGGAALAILTLVGSVLSTGHELGGLPYFGAAIGLFGHGVLFGVIAVSLGYRSLVCGARFEYYTNRALAIEDESEESCDEYLSKAKKWSESFSKLIIYADLSVNTSFVCFGLGIGCCIKAFFL